MSNASDFVKKYREFVGGFEGQVQVALARAEWHERAVQALNAAAESYDKSDLEAKNIVRRMQQRALVYRYFQAAGAIQCPKWVYDVWAALSIRDETKPDDIQICYVSTENFKRDNWLLLTGPLGDKREKLQRLTKQFRGFSDVVYGDHQDGSKQLPSSRWRLMAGLDIFDVPTRADDRIDFAGATSVRYDDADDMLCADGDLDVIYVYNFDWPR